MLLDSWTTELFFKNGREVLAWKLAKLRSTWENEQITRDWLESVAVPFCNMINAVVKIRDISLENNAFKLLTVVTSYILPGDRLSNIGSIVIHQFETSVVSAWHPIIDEESSSHSKINSGLTYQSETRLLRTKYVNTDGVWTPVYLVLLELGGEIHWQTQRLGLTYCIIELIRSNRHWVRIS